MAAGKYLPSYFEIHIDTEDDLNFLNNVSLETQGLYFHEYCHFLQDLTITFGIMKTWNAYDRLRQFLFSIQQKDEVIEIPLLNEAGEKQQRYIKFINLLIGSHGVHHPLIDNKFELKAVNLVNDSLINEMIPNLNAQLVHLTLGQPNLPDKVYSFGERALSESMVYIIESKFYKLSMPAKYPYLVAVELARFIFPPISDNKELLFALCDVSLMHPMPGWAFYYLLNKIKENDIILERGEEVIDFGLETFLQLGWLIDEQIDKAIQGTLYISQQIYGHTHFEHTLRWFQTIVDRGAQLRKKSPYFFLDIYKDNKPLGKALELPWQSLGSPHCIDRQFRRSMRAPEGLESILKQIHPQHLRISWQLNQFLLNGKIPCQLHEVCSTSLQDDVTDDRCTEHPWERIKDEFGCPYASAWAIYGFNNKRFKLDGQQIEPFLL